jgi:hypothetical protein
MWGLPLVVATVVFHSWGLGAVDHAVSFVLNRNRDDYGRYLQSMTIMGGTALCATLLHGIEAMIWAVVYCQLGALPDKRTAVLYSLNALTSYGHTDLSLSGHWQLMGALEALDGWIVFGLTTAFLFTVIQRLWPRIQLPLERSPQLPLF